MIVFNQFFKTFILSHDFSKVFLDVLPTVGTPHILPAIKKIIADKMISPLSASVVINTVALTIRPTKEVVALFLVSLDPLHHAFVYIIGT